MYQYLPRARLHIIIYYHYIADIKPQLLKIPITTMNRRVGLNAKMLSRIFKGRYPGKIWWLIVFKI